MPLALIARLQEQAGRRPDDTAVRLGGSSSRLSWRQWHDGAASLAHRLRESTSPDAAVVLGIGNHPAFHVAFVGALLADRKVMPVSPDCTSPELGDAVRRTGATAAIGSEAFLRRLPHGDATDDLLRIAADSLIGAAPSARPAESAPGTDIWACHEGRGALLLGSSGTTGPPKIVQRLAPSLDAVAESCARGIGFRHDDRVLLTVPLHHSYGLEHGLLAPLMAGSRVELVDTFDPDLALDLLLQGSGTILPSVPFVFDALVSACQRPGALERTDRSRGAAGLAALRCAYSAGSPLPCGVFEAWQTILGVRLGQLYGSTEVGSVTFNDPGSEDFDPLSVGSPLPGAELRIVDPRDPDPARPLPTGTEGRVAVTSSGMMEKYLDGCDGDIVKGYFLTNDLGRLDAQGRLTLTGRLNLLIDLGGRKVNPAEVEAVLMAHPHVADAVVLAMPMTETINRLRAIVVPKFGEEVDLESLRRFARKRLSPHKLPRVYEVRRDLPRTTTGKVRREMLRWA